MSDGIKVEEIEPPMSPNQMLELARTSGDPIGHMLMVQLIVAVRDLNEHHRKIAAKVEDLEHTLRFKGVPR